MKLKIKPAGLNISELSTEEVDELCKILEVDGWTVSKGFSYIQFRGTSEKCSEVYKEVGGIQYQLESGVGRWIQETQRMESTWKNNFECSYYEIQNEKTKTAPPRNMQPWDFGFNFLNDLTAEEFLKHSKELLRITTKATEKLYKINFTNFTSSNQIYLNRLLDKLEADGWIIESELRDEIVDYSFFGNTEICGFLKDDCIGMYYRYDSDGDEVYLADYGDKLWKSYFTLPESMSLETFVDRSKGLKRVLEKISEKVYQEWTDIQSDSYTATPKKVTRREFTPAQFEVVPASKLEVGDMIFGSGVDSNIERTQNWLGVDYGLDLKFYVVTKVNRSSFWVMEYVSKKKFRMAKWYWDGSGEMSVRRVPKSWKKRVLDRLIENSIAYKMENTKVAPK